MLSLWEKVRGSDRAQGVTSGSAIAMCHGYRPASVFGFIFVAVDGTNDKGGWK